MTETPEAGLSDEGTPESAGVIPAMTSVALAIPAYNEADGIGGFISELDESLARLFTEHTFVVVDDTSKDATVQVLRDMAPSLHGEMLVIENDVNLGHGPTVIKAYRRAIATGADWILQVDGDGQFLGDDIQSLTAETDRNATIVTGARDRRFDPWYRTVLTSSLPLVLRAAFGVNRQDVNCPFRLYRADVLSDLLDQVPDDSLTPHVLLTVLEARSDQHHAEVIVRHRPRRGDSEVGTTWQQGRNLLIPRRLIDLCSKAALQLVEFRRAG